MRTHWVDTAEVSGRTHRTLVPGWFRPGDDVVLLCAVKPGPASVHPGDYVPVGLARVASVDLAAGVVRLTGAHDVT